MRNLLYLIIIMLITGLTACSTVGRKSTDRPDWVSGNARQYPANLYLTGKGSSTTLNAASDRARAEIAKIFEVEIAEASVDRQQFERKTTAGKPDEVKQDLSVTRQIETRSERLLRGVEIADTWQDNENGIFYALAVLKRQPAARLLRAEIRQHDERTRRDIATAATESDLLKKIAAASRAVDEQQQRATLQRSLQILVPGNDAAPRWALGQLQADRDALLQRVTLVPHVSGEFRPDLQPLVEAAIARAGFSIRPDAQQVYRLDVGLDLDEPLLKDRWYWLRGTLEVRLLEGEESVRGVRRWPVKASAQNRDVIYRRLLDQVNTILLDELRATVFGFADK